MLWIVVAALVGNPSTGPTYLTCSIDRMEKPFTADVSINEAAQTATVSIPSTGHVVRGGAIFSATEVKLADGPSTWIVDRVTLGFQRSFEIGDHRSVERGTCKLQPAPTKRAF